MNATIDPDEAIHLSSSSLSVGLLRFGGRISHLRVLLPDGGSRDVAVGFDSPADYRADSSYQGAMVGRVANRIGGGRFSLDGSDHRLATNDGGHTLHGGPGGFSGRDWTPGPVQPVDDGAAVDLTLHSPAGDQGFPGNLDVRVTISVTGSELQLRYRATSDAATPVMLTNHTYFNLAGAGSVGGHRVRLNADRYLPIDPDVLTTGEIADVSGTPLDFRHGATLDSRWRLDHETLRRGKGFDHCLVLADDAPTETQQDGTQLREVGEVLEPGRGIAMTVLTDQPAVQFYTGGFLDGTQAARSGLLRQGDAFCLETQGFPGFLAHPNFPQSILLPDEEYRHTTVYRFELR